MRQRAKGPIDPRLGERIRQLRISRGLTQQDLAGGDFTKGFISLLETGRTRVSLRAAEILAGRLDTTASELLAGGTASGSELELLLLRAEHEVALGRGTEAVGVLERVVADSSGLVRARALRSLGRALVEAGRAREGIGRLEAATAAFESLGQRELRIRTLYDRAVAYANVDEPGNALALALECESAMRVGNLIDKTLELQLRSLLAATFARAGDLDSAEIQGRQALQLADDVVDAEALGTLYSTLSVTRQRQGDLDEALKYARKGLSVFEERGRDRAIGQVWQNVAAIHLARGDFTRAEDAAARADKIAESARIPSLAARVLALRAELAAAQRRWKSAEELAAAAAEHPQASAVTRGRGWLIRARALAARRAPQRTIRDAFDRAAKALQHEPGSSRSEVHATYAELLADRGEWKPAYEQSQKAWRLLQPKLR